MNSSTSVKNLRDALAAQRQFDSPSAAAQRSSGRNVGGTIAAQDRQARATRAAVKVLVEAGRKDIVGQLAEEDNLTRRIAAAKRVGQERPELVTRLAETRRTVRAALKIEA